MADRRDQLPKRRIRYVWSCGGKRCKTEHRSVEAARKCPKRKTNVRRHAFAERNEQLWNLVVAEGMTLRAAGRLRGISGSRVQSIIKQLLCRKERGLPRDERVWTLQDVRKKYGGGDE